jgi:dCMP deaminase
MDSRPGFETVYMEFAESIAKRSTCKRLQVGTVITTTDYRKVLAVEYNGNASGLPNSCDRDEAGNCGCLHSEENAAINCDSPRSTEKVVFVTHLPCPMCAKRLVNLGNVIKLVFKRDYRLEDSKAILKGAGIEAIHFDGS